MDDQLLLSALSLLYSFVSLPALAIAGIAYFLKFRTNGGMLFGGGATAAAIGSMYNKIIPWQNLLSETQHRLPDWVHITMAIALIIHLIGLNMMVIGLLMMTFGKQKEYLLTTGFTRSQGPIRFETFWVNEMPRCLELSGIPCAR